MANKENNIWADGSLWKWVVAAGAAAAVAIGAWSWSGDPVGVPADQASDPTAHTAPEDQSPGDMIRDQLDPRD